MSLMLGSFGVARGLVESVARAEATSLLRRVLKSHGCERLHGFGSGAPERMSRVGTVAMGDAGCGHAGFKRCRCCKGTHGPAVRLLRHHPAAGRKGLAMRMIGKLPHASVNLNLSRRMWPRYHYGARPEPKLRSTACTMRQPAQRLRAICWRSGAISPRHCLGPDRLGQG